MDRKLLLLGILRQHEMHGYQLFEYIDQGLAVCTDMTKPTAYYLLGKMAADGWIIEEQTQEGNRPPRKVYRLSSRGEAEYQRLLRENLANYQPMKFPGDSGLGFLDDLPADEGLELLSKRRAAVEAALQVAKSAPEHRGSFQWVIQHQVFHLKSELDWLDGIISQVQSTTH